MSTKIERSGAADLLKCRPVWKLVFDDGSEVLPDDFQAYMLQQGYLNEAVAERETFRVMLHNPRGSSWQPILHFGRLRPDTYHRFRELEGGGPASHLLVLLYPNGGIHGLRVYGSGSRG